MGEGIENCLHHELCIRENLRIGKSKNPNADRGKPLGPLAIVVLCPHAVVRHSVNLNPELVLHAAILSRPVLAFAATKEFFPRVLSNAEACDR